MTFDEYLTNCLPTLLRYATVVTCDPHLAQDVVQEVLARAQPRWQRICAMEQPGAYLKRMVLNEFLTLRRRLAARRPALLPRDALAVADPAAAVIERQHLLWHIARLPPRQRAVIALRFYEDLTDIEIATLLECRLGTVRSLSSRAIATLRASLWAQSAPVGVPGMEGLAHG
ncbi:RNA polymerase sigma24 factor [Catellatospora methionotrophica]|uniref:RNA polymerase sigma24 factor n=1 Tax=Catellatospora methionotrophica TaxID=121620 RepID=A0A8J3LG46_9ACTN|nr:sigma-70 family RNA polymerase sigma factor [Catellatospora methionotrophica]GIG14526.1 RNA polymerase sigma24 factor [Catellatospora methionotrophica]